MKYFLYIFFVFASLTALFAHASPSAFPETAAYGALGYMAGPAANAGFELIVPVPLVDASVGLEAFADLTGSLDARLSGTALVFPALGTTPPLALGLGVDVNYGERGFALHAGPTVGTDLLFTLDLPMIASLYLAPGYSSAPGLSLAWAAYLRYYLDDFAIELASTDLLPVSLGLRYTF